uniref:Uncharacterized protein n=1 Tax=Molossus molossus TaxID=27622 RepID=A0A7J8GQD2_MOLMO|nr:hypothetical protein HJG59_011279 [Molossus molossus]
MAASPPHSGAHSTWVVPARQWKSLCTCFEDFFHIRAPGLSPDLPLLTIWSITLQRTPQGWETSNKAPCDHHGSWLTTSSKQVGPGLPMDALDTSGGSHRPLLRHTRPCGHPSSRVCAGRYWAAQTLPAKASHHPWARDTETVGRSRPCHC